MYDEILFELNKIPLFDVHTHIDALHLSARGLHDILFYHMVISDLYSAGCPNGSRLSEEPTNDEMIFRIEQAIPYLQYIQNTSCFWGVRIILNDLYGWDKPITQDNWQEVHEIICKKYQDRLWAREILKKAGIIRIGTELWRGHHGEADDILQYSLEWAFFTRCQWGLFDTALLELENAWGQDEPGAPLSVTMREEKVEMKRKIKTLNDVREAIMHYCDKIPYCRILSIASHLSTDIDYRMVSDTEMEEALARRNEASVKERDIYANYIQETFFNEMEKRKPDIVLQFSIGAEPLPYETGSKLRSDTVFRFAEMLQKHPTLKFQVFLSNEHQSQAMCTLARECPNLSLSGYWWHNFFPETIKRVINQRLDMLASNKQIGFFSDAYCVDWAYAKSVIVRKQWVEVLSDKIEQGQYTKEQALAVARQILYDSPKIILGMK